MRKNLKLFGLIITLCLVNCVCYSEDISDEDLQMLKTFAPFYKYLETCTPIKTKYQKPDSDDPLIIYQIIGRRGNYCLTKEGNEDDLSSCSYPVHFAKELSKEFSATGDPQYDARNEYCSK